MLTDEEMARIIMVLDLSTCVRTWCEGYVSGEDAMKNVHKALLAYREALK